MSFNRKALAKYIASLYFTMHIGFLVFFTKINGARSRSFSLSRRSDIMRFIKSGDVDKYQYLTAAVLGTAPSQHKRGTAKDAKFIAYLWCDIDFRGGIHATSPSKLPTKQEVLEMFPKLPFEISLAIDSGGGFYALAIYKEPLDISDDHGRSTFEMDIKGFQHVIRTNLKSINPDYHLDNTTSAAQVLRPVGAVNDKYNTHVSIAHESEVRYNPGDFAEFLAPDEPTPPAAISTQGNANRPLVDGALVLQNCAFTRNLIENPQIITEPQWFDLARSLNVMEQGRDMFHAASAPDPRYNFTEAEAKFNNAGGYAPPACKDIQAAYSPNECATCVAKEHITYPHEIAYDRFQMIAFILPYLHMVKSDNLYASTDDFFNAVKKYICEMKGNISFVKEILKKLGVRITEWSSAFNNYLKNNTTDNDMYFEKSNCIYMRKYTQSGPVDAQMSNFTLRMIAENYFDDGSHNPQLFIDVEGMTSDGEILRKVTVSSRELETLHWITTNYGVKLIIQYSMRTHFLNAIKTISAGNIARTKTYTHTGFRRIEGQMVYLYQGGCISDHPLSIPVNVELQSEKLRKYDLSPVEGVETATAITTSMKTLDLLPKVKALPLFLMPYVAVLSDLLVVDFSVMLVGTTGTFKSALAGIALAHFGREFSGTCLTASYLDTANALERVLFTAKNALSVVDDFVPRGAKREVDEAHAKFERVGRSIGNRAARQRMTSTTELRDSYYARDGGLLTGEDKPRGESLGTRCGFIEVDQGNVDLDTLTELQKAGRDAVLVMAMRAFILFVIRNHDRLETELPPKSLEYRNTFSDALAKGYHGRTPEILAKLFATFNVFVSFAVDAGALDRHQAVSMLNAAFTELLAFGNAQTREQADEDTTVIFLETLRSLLSSKRVYLEDENGGQPQPHALLLGWNAGGNEAANNYFTKGDWIGWIGSEGIFLDPNLAYQQVTVMLGQSGRSLGFGVKAVLKRLKEKGHLKSTSANSNTVRRNFKGATHRVMHLDTALIIDIAQRNAQLPDFVSSLFTTDEPAPFGELPPDIF